MGTYDISIFQGTLIFRYFKQLQTSTSSKSQVRLHHPPLLVRLLPLRGPRAVLPAGRGEEAAVRGAAAGGVERPGGEEDRAKRSNTPESRTKEKCDHWGTGQEKKRGAEGNMDRNIYIGVQKEMSF